MEESINWCLLCHSNFVPEVGSNEGQCGNLVLYSLSGLSLQNGIELCSRLCHHCRSAISGVNEGKELVEESEKEVRRRQVELLKELRKLEGQLGDFKRQALQLEQLVLASSNEEEGKSRMQTGEMLQFRESVLQVVGDLLSYYRTTCLGIRILSNKINVKNGDACLSSQVNLEGVEVKIEVDTGNQSEDDDSLENLNTVTTRSMAHSPVKLKQEDFPEEEEMIPEDVGSPISNKDSSDEDFNAASDANSEDEDYKPVTRRASRSRSKKGVKVLKKRKPVPRKAAQKCKIEFKKEETNPSVAEQKKKTNPDKISKPAKLKINIYNLHQDEIDSKIKGIKKKSFKYELIRRVLIRNKRREVEGLLYNEKRYNGSDDQYIRQVDRDHFVDYNQKSGVLHVSGIEIQIDEKTKALSCGACGFSSAGPKYKRMIHGRVETHLQDHILGEHLQVYKCPHCSTTLKSRVVYTIHVQKHKIIPNFNQPRIKSKPLFKIPRKKKFLPVYCDICGKPCHKHMLSVHKWTHKNAQEKVQDADINPYNTGIFPCPTCGKEFTCDMGLKQHLRQAHDPMMKEKVICSTCGKSFSRLCIAKHSKTCGVPADQKRKQTVTRQKCDFCDKYFAKKSMTNHLAAAHDINKKLFQCHLCPKTLNYEKSLNDHLLKHSQDKKERQKLSCSKNCGLKFVTKGAQKKHEENCDGVLTCVICSRKMKSLKWLARHMEVKHSKPEEGYPCSHCTKEFNTKKALTGHLRRVSGVRPYLCRKGCGAGFKEHNSRGRHEKACQGSGTAHGRRPTYVAPPTVPLPPPQANSLQADIIN